MKPEPDLALRLLGQGWPGLLPILPPDAEPAEWFKDEKLEEFLKGCGKAPGQYLGDGRWANLGNWPEYPDDEATIEAWAQWPGVGIGLRGCHDATNVALIDSDILDPDTAGEARRRIRKRIGLDAPVRVGRAPKEAYPVRTSARVRKTKTAEVLIDEQKCAVELIGAGGQAVIAGVHPVTKLPYHWPLGGLDGITPADLPLISAHDLGGLLDELESLLLSRGPRVGRAGRQRDPGAGAGTARPAEELRARKPLLVLAAALAIRNDDRHYDDWVRHAYALRGAFGDVGRALWDAFSAQSDKHAPAATASVWADVTKAEARGELRSGANAIVETAAAEGWTLPAALPTEVPDLPGATLAGMAALRAYVAEAAEREAAQRARDAEAFAFMRRGAAVTEGGAQAGPEPHYPADELPPEGAAERLRAVVRDAIAAARAWSADASEGKGEPPVRGVKAAAGLGKTIKVLEELARLPQPLEVWFFVPTVALATEAAAKAEALGLKAQVIRGREAVVDDEPLCAKHEEAAIVARAGLPVMRMLCRKKNKRTKQVETCPFHDECHYLTQFSATGPAVRFFAHEYLWTPSPAGLPKPDLIMIDEAFALGAARHASFGIDRLTAPRTGMPLEREALIHDAAVRVRDLLEGGEDPRTAAGAEQFALMADVEGDLATDEIVWPSMRWERQKERLAKLKATERFKVAALWRVLGKEVGREAPLQRVELRRDEPTPNGELQDRVHVWWRAALRLPVAPILVLDASLGERLARKLLPGIGVETIASRRNAEVIQAHDTPCSRRRLLGFKGASDEERRRAANRMCDLRHLAEVEAWHGHVLLVTYKPAKDHLGGTGAAVANFGGLRGLDAFKGHDTVIVAGREQPTPAGGTIPTGHYKLGIEDYARSLFGDEPEPLELTGTFTTKKRGYRMRDGARHGVEVAVHADDRCQTILEQIRERETEQALDRLRLIHRAVSARVILLSNVVVDVTVDRLARWNELVPARLTVATARLDGVLPLAPAWLAERFPDLWATAEAARLDVRRAEKGGQTPNRKSCLGFDHLSAVYRVEGQRGSPSRALIRADHPEPRVALTRLVGPLAMFRWEGEASRKEPEASPPADPSPDRADFMDPRSWAGFVQDVGEPEPFTFRGAGPPATATVEGVFATGRRVVVSIWPAEPGTSVEVATAA